MSNDGEKQTRQVAMPQEPKTEPRKKSYEPVARVAIKSTVKIDESKSFKAIELSKKST